MKIANKPKPTKAFPGQHDGETVELVFHQHPLVMRKELFVGFFAILVAELIWALPALVSWIPQSLNTFGWQLLKWTLIAVLIYWGYRFIGWYYSVYIVTDERLVEIKQKGFFNRKVTEFGLDKIQNINYHIRGFQAVIFQYGDITAQTYVGDLVMKTIYRPVVIHEQIVDIVRRVNSSLPPGA